MEELAGALRPRFVDAAAKDGLYESLYFTAHHPIDPKALWVRHTVLKAPGGPPRASLWCTWFADGGVRATKMSVPEATSAPGRLLQVGEHGWIDVDGATGAVDHPQLRARWELGFRDPEPPMFHLPNPWMYSTPLPRTKSISAAPRLTLAGSLDIDGSPVKVEGWPCTLGHNWGAEHAERWVWVHADAEDQQPLWVDLVIGRIRLGPVTTPWIANGAISIDGQRHRLGGVRPGAGTRVSEHDRGATVVVRGKDIAVEVCSEIDLPDCVAWTYADPAGKTSEVVNSSVARAVLRIDRPDRGRMEVTAPVTAFELGAPRRAFDIPLQPFPD